MTPVGRLAATALATPAKPAQDAPRPVPSRVEDTAETAVTPGVPAEPMDRPERREEIDPTCLTTEMEPISEAVEQKRTIDATLARFSAVHDEMAAEEAQRRSRRVRLMPWLGKDDDLEEALSSAGPVSPAEGSVRLRKPARPAAEPRPRAERSRPRPPVEQAEPAEPGHRMPKSKTGKLTGKAGRSLVSAKMAAVGVAVLVLVGSFFGWRAVHDNGGNGGGIQEVAALDENSPAILESQKQYGDSNFLLVGTASRPGANAAADQTTNTIMVVHIPVDGSRAAVVSFPPGLRVDRPVCQQWDNRTNRTTGQVPAQTGVRLSSIYATGGPRCVTDTVQQLSGLRINHFVGVDTGGFGTIMSGLQGVPMCVAGTVHDAKLGTIVPKGGQVTLAGKQALKYVSADAVTGDKQPADLGRIGRQQRFLAAVLRKTIGQQKLLLSPSLLNDFLGTFTKATFDDNMGVAQLAKLAGSLQGLALGRITFVTVPATIKGDTETLQASTSKQLFNAIIDNSPLPGETGGKSATTKPAKPVAPADIKLQVINATQIANAAGDTADSLRSYGFQITQIGGAAPRGVKQTEIRYAAGQSAEAQLVASSVPSATLRLDPSMGGAIQVIIGSGFDGQVHAPHAGVAATPDSEAPAGLSYVNAADSSCS